MKCFYFLIIFSIMFLINTKILYTQYAQFTCIAVNKSNGWIYGARYLGHIYYSTNQGQNWIEINTGGIVTLRSMLVLENGDIYVGGYKNPYLSVYKSTDNGTNWVNMLNISTGGIVIAILQNTLGNIFALYQTKLFKTTNSGLGWTEYPMPGNARSMFIDQNDKILIGGDNKVYISTDNGENWEEKSNGIHEPYTTFYLEAITSNSSGTILVSDDTRMFISTDDGETWTPKLIFSGISPSSLLYTNSGNFLASTREGTCRSTDNGHTWSGGLGLGYPHAISQMVNGLNSEVYSMEKYDEFEPQREGRIYYSNNDGLNPIEISNPPLPVELFSFQASYAFKKVILNWSTVTEIDNFCFEVERSYTCGSTLKNWNKIGIVYGRGNSNTINNYSFMDNQVNSAGLYKYRLKQIDKDGNYSYSQEIEINVGNLPSIYSLMQNYPNPFNPSTLIRYELPNESSVKLIIYNSLGQVVKELVSEVQQSGYYEVNFNASNLSSGIYYYSISATSTEGNKEFRDVKKLMLLK